MPATHPPDELFIALQERLAGRYSLERELGRGGMGVVYLARDVTLDRPVALKLLPPDSAEQPQVRERFLREARTAARLSHPHIVPIHTVEEAGDFVFFVMAFVEGETLGRRVRERGPLHPRDAARILREVAWALSYAHAQGVVHRDVKPDNVLLEAGSGRALVTDFGIAHVAAGPGGDRAAEVLGTPEYMSPEQARSGAVDGRSDLYALGVVGHYALTGRLPFEGGTAHATLALHLTREPPRLARTAPELPIGLTQTLDRCLEKDPELRVQTGEALAEAFGRVLGERREAPVAIRLFSDQNRESNAAIAAVAMMVVMTAGMVAALSIEGAMDAASILFVTLATALWGLVPAGLLAAMARRLLVAGYGYDEMIEALESEVQERRRELASEVRAASGRMDRWAPWAMAGGLLTLAAGIALIPYISSDLILEAMIFGGGLGGVAAGIWSAARHVLTRAVPGERWLRFWKTPVGRTLFGVAGLGLSPNTLPAGGSFRPTELAIGMAAERLFEELPRDVRKSLGDVPGVVRMLEGHAERTRRRLAEIDGILQVQVGGAADPQVTGLRAATEVRLREVVAALEKLRLELLHLHAGSGSVPGLTADLSAARSLAEDMERLAEGHREVRRLLGEPTPPEPLTPQPA